MAAEANDSGIIRYVITGGESRDDVPRNATHFSVHPSVKVLSFWRFMMHPSIVELVCHDGVIKVDFGFWILRTRCRLKRLIMKGVEEVGMSEFERCNALEYVECDKVEKIGYEAFSGCTALSSINLPSARTISTAAFQGCERLKHVKFGTKLEAIGSKAFYNCSSLQRITIPLKNGLFDHEDVFRECWKLKHVDLVDREVLQESADALLREEWKNDMNAKIESIDQVLPNTTAGNVIDDGKKAIVIRQWISEVLDKIIYYKSQHHCLLNEAASSFQLALPHDIVMNNIVPFLTIPQHTFDGEEEIVESNGDNESIDDRYSFTVGSDEEKEEDNNDGSQEGAAETGEGRKQEGANDEERRKRQRTEINGTM